MVTGDEAAATEGHRLLGVQRRGLVGLAVGDAVDADGLPGLHDGAEPAPELGAGGALDVLGEGAPADRDGSDHQWRPGA